MLTTIFEAIVLGIVQGATEYIPVSSSAHLIIVPWLVGWNDPALTSLSFDVALHLGTLLAVLVFFGRDWIRLIQAFFRSLIERKIGTDPDRRLAWFVVIGTIPGAFAGVLLESNLDALFHRPGVPISTTAMLLLAGIIAGFGILLFLADRFTHHTRSMGSLTWKDTLLIGLAQALAVFPGVSRSGSTITAGLVTKLNRETAAKFSFLLSAPIIAGAGLKSLWEMYSGLRTGAISHLELVLFPVGFVLAAISGFLCIRFLLNYLKQHSLSLFAYYRWGLAVLVAVVALLRR